MLSEEKKEDIINKMKNKKIKDKFQKYILEYIELNIELFPFINIDILIERLIENFNKISINYMSILYKNFGEYVPTTGKILIAPNLYYGKNRKYKESVILHELDHCACSPMMIKKKYNEFKKDFFSKHKLFSQIIPDVILSQIFFYNYDLGPLSGVANFKNVKGYTRQKLLTGTNWTNLLNEGITSFKQIMYSDKLGIKFHQHKDFYSGTRMGIQCLSKVIGFEKVIMLHFNNNLSEIEYEFNSKVSCITLEELILKCSTSNINRSRRNLKKIHDMIGTIEKEV